MTEVSNFNQVCAALSSSPLDVATAARHIAYKSHGRYFVDAHTGRLMKHYQYAKGAPVEHVDLTFRDFKKSVIWLNELSAQMGQPLDLYAVPS